MAKTYVVIGSLGDRGKKRLDVLLPYLRSTRSNTNILVNWQIGQDEAPRGFARAYNSLLTGAFADPECQFAWILGDDVMPFDSCLADTQMLMELDPTIGAMYPVEAWGANITMLPFDGKVVPIEAALSTTNIEQIFPGMACCCLSRAAWEAVGPIDEQIGLGYGEDFDWGIRCWKAGYRVVNYRGAYFHHQRGATYNQLIADGVIDKNMPYEAADALKRKWPELELWKDQDPASTSLLNKLRTLYQESRAGRTTPAPVV